MQVSQTVRMAGGEALEETITASSRASDARFAGLGLLVTVASIILLYGGSGAVVGTRPDHAADAATVATFYDNGALVLLLFQATISVVGLVFFAIAYRRYALPSASTPAMRQLLDFGVTLAILEAPVLLVEFGLQLSLVRLASLGDPALLGVYQAWDWIDNGTMLVFELAWVGVLSIGAWRTRVLPRWLAGLGIAVALTMALAALPSLPLNYPDGITMVAYAPFIAWFVAAGAYLWRGGVERGAA